LAEDIVLLYFSDYRIEGGGGAIVKHPWRAVTSC
jgi:hypothetical protein